MKGFVCHDKELESNLAGNWNALTGKWHGQIRVLDRPIGSNVDDGVDR